MTEDIIRRKLAISLVLILAVAAVISGVLVAQLMTKTVSESVDTPSDLSFGFFRPGPDSIQNMVNRADAIVIGTVGPALRELRSGAPNQTDTFSGDNPPPPRFVYTVYPIVIDDVLLNDGVIQSQSSPTLMVQGRAGSEFDFGREGC